MTGPQPPDPHWPRYSTRPFPSYRFVPGKSPHPRRDPKGHSYGQPEPRPAAIPPDDWQKSEEYLYGIDLYNFGYWWECHEIFEGLWHAAGHKTEQGNFFQALIQVAAANLKTCSGETGPAGNLARNGLVRLHKIPPRYMGVTVEVFAQDMRRYFDGTRDQPALIALIVTIKP